MGFFFLSVFSFLYSLYPIREEVVLPVGEEVVLPVREEYVLPILFLFRPIPAEITSGRGGKGNQQAAHLHAMPKGYPLCTG